MLQKAAIYFPDDRDVLAAYGKALASGGQLEQALDAVQRAQTPDKPDWQLISAEAAILDQMGNARQARASSTHRRSTRAERADASCPTTACPTC